MIAAPSNRAFICDRCVNECTHVLQDMGKNQTPQAAQIRTPRALKSHLDEHVIAQDDAKREVAIAVYEHLQRRAIVERGGITVDGETVEVEKSNIILMGPSGSGKTHIARSVARWLDVPFYVGDATRLSQAGYVGDDVETLLQGLMADANQDAEKAQWGIIFIDEFDKLARKSGRSASGFRDITGESVQQSLLKLIEGSKVQVPRGHGSRAVSGASNTDMIDTTNILFIGSGSFAGIEEIVDRRLNKGSRVGFGGEHRQQRDKTSIYRQVVVEDLEDFGMIPEIVGRMPVITSTYELTEQELIRVLVEPRNSIIKQFRALFSMDNIDLQFDQGALETIAREAKKRSTGARALRGIVKATLKPYSFEVPDASDIAAIKITSEAVTTPGAGVIMRQAIRRA